MKLFKAHVYFLFSFLLISSPSSNATMLIDKIRVNLSASQQIDSIKISNPDKTHKLIVNITPKQWTQKDGKDNYAQTKEILIAPPIATIKPESSQIIRIALRRPIDPQQELAYRLYFREIQPFDREKANNKGVIFRMQFSVPVFIAPQAAISQKLIWRVSREKSGILITLQNLGNNHVQIKNFSLKAEGQDKPLINMNLASYLLPGQTGKWPIKGNFNTAKIILIASTDQGDFTETLPLK